MSQVQEPFGTVNHGEGLNVGVGVGGGSKDASGSEHGCRLRGEDWINRFKTDYLGQEKWELALGQGEIDTACEATERES